jgi:hypothetical protein
MLSINDITAANEKLDNIFIQYTGYLLGSLFTYDRLIWSLVFDLKKQMYVSLFISLHHICYPCPPPTHIEGLRIPVTIVCSCFRVFFTLQGKYNMPINLHSLRNRVEKLVTGSLPRLLQYFPTMYVYCLYNQWRHGNAMSNDLPHIPGDVL